MDRCRLARFPLSRPGRTISLTHALFFCTLSFCLFFSSTILLRLSSMLTFLSYTLVFQACTPGTTVSVIRSLARITLFTSNCSPCTYQWQLLQQGICINIACLYPGRSNENNHPLSRQVLQYVLKLKSNNIFSSWSCESALTKLHGIQIGTVKTIPC